MKLFDYTSRLLIASLLFFSACASQSDKVFENADPHIPEKIERQVELPNELKEKFQIAQPVEPKGEINPDEIKPEKKKEASKSVATSTPPTPTPVATPASVAAPAETETPESPFATLSPEEMEVVSHFEEWDRQSRKAWFKYSPLIYVGEELIYEVSFLGVHAGHIRMLTKPETKIGERPVYNFYAQLKSGSWYDFIYKLDDYLESFVDKETFRPVKYTLYQRESNQKVDDLQLFDFEQQKTYLDYYRLKDNKEKKELKEAPIPFYFQDSYSALPFLRGIDLKIGDSHQIPIVTRGKIWLLKFKVDSIEEVKIQGKWIDAYKIKAETQFPGVLEKRGDILFWFEKSELRRPLKFQAKVKIGSIEGVLIDYKPGQKAQE